MNFRILAVLLSLFYSPALAQWQTPNHSVPIGLGGGNIGFNAAVPGAAGQPLRSTGPAFDPAFGPLNLGNSSAVTGQLPNANLGNMNANTVKCNNTAGPAIPIDCTVAQARTLLGVGSLGVSVTDAPYNAKGDGVTDDTAAFQAAITAACGTSGFGRLRIPATAASYLVSKINQTNCNNAIIEGDGDQSVIKITGFDVQGNWWDLSGSNNIQFKNLRIIDNGSPTRIIFLWACTGTNCGTSGVINGLAFDHVNINAKHVLAGLYGYGYGCAANCASNISGASLSISNSSWKNTYNGPVSSERTRDAVLSLTAYNSGAVLSAYATITATTAIAARTHLYNVDLIDFANGTSLSSNAAMVLDGTNQFVSTGGSYQCQCVADVIMWTSVEGVVMNMPAFQAPIIAGDGCTVFYWVEMGGGLNGAMTFNTPFWSCPLRVYIALDQAISAGNGGLNLFTLNGTDPGLNTHGAPFIGQTIAGCGPFTPAFNWIANTNVQLLTNASDIVTCGSIDAHSAFWSVGTVTMPGGASDLSHHF